MARGYPEPMTQPAASAAVPPARAAAGGSSDALAAGTRLGEFEILRVLGSGGFGIVYLAHDHALDRAVAIKEYLPDSLARRAGRLQVAVRAAAHAEAYAAGLKSFVGEARILARFDHPAMVKVYRYWEANGTGYMAMPHVQGPTLREWRRSLAAPPTEALLRGIVDPLLEALALLHAEGIYHRDIAPDNVLLPAEGEPVLLDFGAARRVIGDHTHMLTAMLKPSFAPIEQYGEATQLRQGPWTDLYALGAAIVWLLDAAPPPPATVRTLHDEMAPLAERSIPGVSRCFLAAVQWALAVRPQDRPQSVQEFRNALDGRLEPPALRASRAALPAQPVQPALPVSPTVDPDAPTIVSEPRAAAVAAAAAALPPPPPATIDAAERRRSLLLGSFTLVAAGALVSAVLWSRHATLPGTAELPTRAAAGTASQQQHHEAAPARAARAVQRKERPEPARMNTAQAEPALLAPAVAAASPAEACADRDNFVSRAWCMNLRCSESRYGEHAQCVQLRKDQQATRDRGPGLH